MVIPEFMKAPDQETRKRWAGKVTFLWASYGSTIGFGNIMFFPLLCAKHGGLRYFLIPYLVSVVCLGIPILILELGLGQKFQSGNIWP